MDLEHSKNADQNHQNSDEKLVENHIQSRCQLFDICRYTADHFPTTLSIYKGNRKTMELFNDFFAQIFGVGENQSIIEEGIDPLYQRISDDHQNHLEENLPEYLR